MSVQVINVCIAYRCGSPVLKSVLMALANYAHDDGFCFPRQITLAAVTEYDLKTITRAMRTLESMGLIRRVCESRRASHRIYINLDWSADAAEAVPSRDTESTLSRDTESPLSRDTESTLEPSRDTESHLSRDSVSSEYGQRVPSITVIEPSLEPSLFPCETAKPAKLKKAGKGPRPYTDTFEWFWDHYPRKTGVSKADAFDVFDRLTEDEQVEAVNGAEAYSNLCDVEKKEPRFIAHPTTFLNQRRWETLQEPA